MFPVRGTVWVNADAVTDWREVEQTGIVHLEPGWVGIHRDGSRLIQWFHAVDIDSIQVPVTAPVLYDLETGACKCETRDMVNEGACVVCGHKAHESRKYCGALR